GNLLSGHDEVVEGPFGLVHAFLGELPNLNRNFEVRHHVLCHGHLPVLRSRRCPRAVYLDAANFIRALPKGRLTESVGLPKSAAEQPLRWGHAPSIPRTVSRLKLEVCDLLHGGRLNVCCCACFRTPAMTKPSTRAGGRRRKSAKAGN